MNTRHFKPDWEMNASTLLQASSSRRPLDIHREPSAGVVEPDHHRASLIGRDDQLTVFVEIFKSDRGYPIV